MVRPAAIDSTTVSAPTSGAMAAATSSITCGLTASTITAGPTGTSAWAATPTPVSFRNSTTSSLGSGSWTMTCS